jgi:glycine/D-amino acid oxidase-like deaminating enzyme
MSSLADVAIVGTGMFGAAAAKYLSREGLRVVALGPAEPTGEQPVDQHAFAAHYDQGRICRRLGWDPVWAYLDARSLERFRGIEAESGLDFFSDCGSLILIAKSIRDRTDKILSQAVDDGVHVERMDPDALGRRFAMLGLPQITGGVEGLFEPTGAGLLNPRKLVAAQLALAIEAGATLIRGAVVATQKRRGVWRLQVNSEQGHREIRAKSMLIATGALTNHNGALPDDRLLAMQAYTEPNLFFEVDQPPSSSIWDLPPVVTVDPDDVGNANKSTYMIPPVQYPDGKCYMRIGPGMQPLVYRLSTAAEMIEWYRAQQVTPEQFHFLSAAISELIPTWTLPKARHATCIVEKTVTGYPYIGFLDSDETLAVAVGGNGHGARGSDEIGRLAALTVAGKPLDCPLPGDTFTPVTEADPRAVWNQSSKLKPPFGLC